jgi:hypothetical protein
VWLPSGPLAPGWAKRAGTPSSLLASAARVVSTGSAPAGAGSQASFTANVSGTVREAHVGEGLNEIQVSLTVAGRHLSVLGIRIFGQPVDGGGVEMTTSRVQLGLPLIRGCTAAK